MVCAPQNLMILLYFLIFFGQNAHGSEIIDGKKVPENMMLYMASVQSNKSHVCGGFLINEDFVVTAAHCNKNNPTSVVLGTHNLKKVGNDMRYPVVPCKHPEYNSIESGNDIMLLKLTKRARLDQRRQPIQLPKGEMNLTDKAKCRVAGWGFTKTGGKTVSMLQMTEVSIINPNECKKRWNQRLPNNVICAGGYRTNKGFCQGDSGGPLVCGGVAVGVVSYNMDGNCDYPNRPNVYTDVSKYLPWIKKVLKQKHC